MAYFLFIPLLSQVSNGGRVSVVLADEAEGAGVGCEFEACIKLLSVAIRCDLDVF